MSSRPPARSATLTSAGTDWGGRWQTFLFAVVALVVFPLSPLLVEYLVSKEVSIQSLTLAAPMYAIAAGGASKYAWLFLSLVIAALPLLASYGVVIGSHSSPMDQKTVWIAIGFVAAIQLVERGLRHLIRGEKLGQFGV